MVVNVLLLKLIEFVYMLLVMRLFCGLRLGVSVLLVFVLLSMCDLMCVPFIVNCVRNVLVLFVVERCLLLKLILLLKKFVVMMFFVFGFM